MLHKPQNRKQMPGSDLYNVCRRCKRLHHKLKAMSKKREQNSAGRISKSSKCNWRFLSPKSQRRRWRAVTSGARRLQREVKRLSKQLQVPLSPPLFQSNAENHRNNFIGVSRRSTQYIRGSRGTREREDRTVNLDEGC